METQTYLFFNGRCEEAVDFYTKAVGAKVGMMMRFKDSPEPPPPDMLPPGNENKIMHMDMTIGDTTVLASDGHCQGQPSFDGFALSLIINDVAEADRAFAALSEGGEVTQALTKTFFSPRFGMLRDKFGVMWMVLVRA